MFSSMPSLPLGRKMKVVGGEADAQREGIHFRFKGALGSPAGTGLCARTLRGCLNEERTKIKHQQVPCGLPTYIRAVVLDRVKSYRYQMNQRRLYRACRCVLRTAVTFYQSPR